MNPNFLPILASYALLLPLLSFMLLSLLGSRFRATTDWIALGFSGSGFLLGAYIFSQIWWLAPQSEYHIALNWLEIGDFTLNMGVYIDRYSALMLLIVGFVSFLVNLFSTAYMKGDKHYVRYFAYLGLFTFSMLGLVLLDNLIGIFIFWELVGLSSYLLIGFWQTKDSASKASKKAFLLNRIGDAGFLVGIGAFFALFQTVSVLELQSNFEAVAQSGEQQILLFLCGFGLLCGAVGKSAQFPLSIWLPDAMEGPTPVSALIHAATMVAAGIYLLVRFDFALIDSVRWLILGIGTLTGFLAAFAAIAQDDIKKVLAYSTVSQLGYMMMGIGTGTPEFAMFHLLTHACFKACLFLSAGSVIHSLHQTAHELHLDFDTQSMKNMGGLRKVMPVTFWAYVISGAALAGLPFFSGFLSKDAILGSSIAFAQNTSLWAWIIPTFGFITALLTAFYIARQIILVFFGKPRLQAISGKVSETDWAIKAPLLLLAGLSIWLPFSINPLSGQQGWFLSGFSVTSDWGNAMFWAEIGSFAVGLLGLGFAYLIYERGKFSNFKARWLGNRSVIKHEAQNFWSLHQLYQLVTQKTAIAVQNLSTEFWQLDKIYHFCVKKIVVKFAEALARFDQKIIDGIVNTFGVIVVVFAHAISWLDKYFVDGLVNVTAFISKSSGGRLASVQNGKVQGYIAWAFVGFSLLLYLLLRL